MIDAKRAKSFAKLIKNIEVAARAGGADMAGNPALELAVQKAKKTSVPNDNIDRAIKRGAGLTGEVIDYSEIIYEARGPQGSALLIECLTDNKNRAASEVRVAITRNGGTIADPGSVAYLFSRKGVVTLPRKELSEEDVLMAVLDAGAEEVMESGDSFDVHSEPSDLRAVVAGLEEAGIEYETDEVEFVPSMQVELDADAARKFLKLVDALEELDDVQNVYSNADLNEDVLAELDSDD
ncbi:YebC/PmpR family DNA-binding regulatory protein [Arthrobacter pigmenti]|uniref:Probable transcriptional regulatory protein BJ994_001315 n=1 Tax=Arthrobacter pigmenti TaxID=271432 RepID=A0A846RMA1_9MICC|nr:YebC/PmpR family DNA-binding regulatory protein [Arthrobacter pigmenti]